MPITMRQIGGGLRHISITISGSVDWNCVSNCCLSTLRNPLSVLEWLQTITLESVSLKYRASWWDSSPVRYRSAFTPLNTDPPEPAQRATVEMVFSECDLLVATCRWLIPKWDLMAGISSSKLAGLDRVNNRPIPTSSTSGFFSITVLVSTLATASASQSFTPPLAASTAVCGQYTETP
ncbi:hypothetical protein OGAPHI_006685 [Ogataea philodendri]|uniref:Uncharacterized protein n=1 Tax=Ogataea philodendri TaxID=1378263 RepID=A0A9P8T014_9ASCO|nr:uncharacterized protein OGAPHI_006685 [Ogataea philodendri]KAH3661278.1 hypothetical protein OGAPHI_006685 [Ogataea philodendri]